MDCPILHHSCHFQFSPLCLLTFCFQRKEWLSKALDGMTCDPVKEMQEHIKTVGVYLGSEQPTDKARDNALTSLDMLFDWCECIDMARGEINKFNIQDMDQ